MRSWITRGGLTALALLAAGWGVSPQAACAAGPAAAKDFRSAPIKTSEWQNASTRPLETGEIDRLIVKELQVSGIRPAGRTTDEQFVRRIHLDLTGKLPLPADVTEFVADTSPNKRAKLIDRLLDSDEYAAHWAHYWRDVMSARLTDFRGRALSRSFEGWMIEQLKKNRSWDKIARDLLTAEGECRFDDTGKTGNIFFLGAHSGADAPSEMAAETSRVFLGIQINCAQCHDHPYDQWKRAQFHELVAYFARTGNRLVRDTESNRFVGIALTSPPFRREHRMPSKDDPRTGTVVHPKFLDGTSPGRALGDRQRRNSLANAVTGKSNYWFSGAFVNRTWGELMGQSFYQPVDDMGPQKEAMFGPVLTRLAGSFRGTDHDIKALFRAVLNSETYQRQTRLGESAGEHLQFAALYPTRLRADALWDSLTTVLGRMGAPGGGPARRPGAGGPFAGRFGLEGQFKEEFRFDPSLKPEDVEGSIAQALILMNNPQINQRIAATGNNVLGRILSAHASDEEALHMVYLRALARKPTDREKQKCLSYIKKIGKRTEAFEDILWALINSTEFQTKR
ncbi:MAG: DUF1549 domain-containing protein [Planctomycetes bacterium]|nr:DUF1549 domain-containing protein [Planctomycetota bacterium]